MDQGKELPIQHTGNSWSTNQATQSECIQSASQRLTLFPEVYFYET